mgnify:CR=1 FL=1
MGRFSVVRLSSCAFVVVLGLAGQAAADDCADIHNPTTISTDKRCVRVTHPVNGDVVNNAVFESDNDEMVVVRDIELYSLCDVICVNETEAATLSGAPTDSIAQCEAAARAIIAACRAPFASLSSASFWPVHFADSCSATWAPT